MLCFPPGETAVSAPLLNPDCLLLRPPPTYTPFALASVVLTVIDHLADYTPSALVYLCTLFAFDALCSLSVLVPGLPVSDLHTPSFLLSDRPYGHFVAYVR